MNTNENFDDYDKIGEKNEDPYREYIMKHTFDRRY